MQAPATSAETMGHPLHPCRMPAAPERPRGPMGGIASRGGTWEMSRIFGKNSSGPYRTQGPPGYAQTP